MALQFVVPQFIDVEDKILGPISVRQFVTILGGGGAMVVAYQLVYKGTGNFFAFLFVAIVVLGSTITLAFVKINGQPFHFFLLNFFVNLRYPRLRVWNKSPEAIVSVRKREKSGPRHPTFVKAPLSQTKLTQLSLVVDTGGAYHDEDNTSFDLDRVNRRESLFTPPTK